jgi:Xaa-Pro aminopeptidase
VPLGSIDGHGVAFVRVEDCVWVVEGCVCPLEVLAVGSHGVAFVRMEDCVWVVEGGVCPLEVLTAMALVLSAWEIACG